MLLFDHGTHLSNSAPQHFAFRGLFFVIGSHVYKIGGPILFIYLVSITHLPHIFHWIVPFGPKHTLSLPAAWPTSRLTGPHRSTLRATGAALAAQGVAVAAAVAVDTMYTRTPEPAATKLGLVAAINRLSCLPIPHKLPRPSSLPPMQSHLHHQQQQRVAKQKRNRPKTRTWSIGMDLRIQRIPRIGPRPRSGSL